MNVKNPRENKLASEPFRSLSDVAATLLAPLYIRAMESQRDDAIVKDDIAQALVQQLDFDFTRLDMADIGQEVQVALLLRCRQFDRITRDFLDHAPQAVVVHIGCGLDTRFERVDNGLVTWYDLDLPEVITLRQTLIGGEGKRYHPLACPVLEGGWLNTVSIHKPRPFLFLAEGVFMHLDRRSRC